MSKTGCFEYDVLIIGSGISGLSCALAAEEAGLAVAVISKEENISECNTFYAQGGIVARGVEDSPNLLSKDIMEAGDYLNYRSAVEDLADKGPGLVEELLIKKLGLEFCKNQKGEMDFTMEAAHSCRRILHVKDKTGESIEKVLTSAVKANKGIKIFNSHIAIDLITNTHNSRDSQDRYKATRVLGAYVFDQTRDRVCTFFASQVVLATGGVGDLFLHTSNPACATGDGVAMAARIGAEIINAEYIQFHPTILYHRDVKRFLISESLRGEGAVLKNRFGEAFMKRYQPKLKDLAPRDEVARAIFREIERTKSDYVYLDASAMETDVEIRFPGIFNQCRKVGIDIRREGIPVVPAAHYFCGGVKVNLSGESSIPGLYAVGETACTGVHGGNRLASVSLLEGLYYGHKAALDIAQKIAKPSERLKKSIPPWEFPQNEVEFDPILISQDLTNIRNTMWNYAGIVRKYHRLERAQSDLNYLSHRIEKFYKQAKLTRGIIELRNCLLTATVIVCSAFSNYTSIGAHYIEMPKN
ncbi:MAG: L-aspartate oxidase [Spirochaetales bacterium]|nr:L-aspartate oxidase [Spirochaetales bacterium]